MRGNLTGQCILTEVFRWERNLPRNLSPTGAEKRTSNKNVNRLNTSGDSNWYQTRWHPHIEQDVQNPMALPPALTKFERLRSICFSPIPRHYFVRDSATKPQFRKLLKTTQLMWTRTKLGLWHKGQKKLRCQSFTFSYQQSQHNCRRLKEVDGIDCQFCGSNGNQQILLFGVLDRMLIFATK